MDQLPRLGKRELICLLSFTCNYVVFVWRGFLFLWVLGMGYVILLWHSLSLPYNYFVIKIDVNYFLKPSPNNTFLPGPLANKPVLAYVCIIIVLTTLLDVRVYMHIDRVWRLLCATKSI